MNPHDTNTSIPRVLKVPIVLKKIQFFLLCNLVFLSLSICAAEITELPLGTSGDRAFIVHDTTPDNPFIITDDLEYSDLSEMLEYYFDEQRTLSPQTLNRQDFRPTKGRVAWGYRDAACWFAFDYKADVTKPKNLNLKVLVTGFPLTVKPGDHGTIYIYLDYPAGILSHARLYSAELYSKKANARLVLNALILGMNVALLLYNIVIFIWTKEKVFLYFVLFLFTFTLHIYLREDYISSLLPFFKDYFFSMPPFVFAILFTRKFLETRKTAFIIHHVFSGFLVIGIVFSVLQIIGFRSLHIVQVVANFYKIGIAFLAVILGVFLTIRKNRLGFLYLVSWLPIIISNFILQFEQIGTLQTNGPFLYFIVREGLYASGIFQAVLLSITLADKINIFRSNEENARLEAVKLKELDKKKTDFLMNVSHELRTPLTLILGTVDNFITGKYGTSVHHTHRSFEVLQRNTSRLLFMINNLLNTSLLERKKGEKRLEHIAIDGYLLFLVSEFESLAKMKNISLSYNKTCSSPVISADPELVEIIFLNLFSNAFKFVSKDGSIDIRLECTGDECTIAVYNSGQEIEAEELDRIFDRFYRTDETAHQKYEGIGIGLSLVKNAVTELKGHINVRNHSGKGVEFLVTLPCKESSGEPAKKIPGSASLKIVKDSFPNSPSSKNETLNTSSIKERPPVLIVEDNKDLQEFLSSELASYFTLHIAGNGIEAMELIQRGYRPQLIISDIMMPKMDGTEFYAALKDQGFTNIPFLFLTARASEDEKITALESGVIDYLYKPFLPKELIAKAQTILEQNHMTVTAYKNDLKERILKTLEDDEYAKPETGNEERFTSFVQKHNLSPREKEVAKLLLKGLPDKEIAAELNIAVSTVSNTLHRIYKKAEISGRVDLLRILTGYSN